MKELNVMQKKEIEGGNTSEVFRISLSIVIGNLFRGFFGSAVGLW